LPIVPGSGRALRGGLGEAGININYGYGGAEPDTNTPFLIFGVAEAGEAAKIFELLPPALRPN
jgi:hypothetical protein